MADNTASLVVALSAQLTKFEKDMRAAGIMADKAVGDIEDKFSKMNPKISTSFFGNFFANLADKAISAAIDGLKQLIDRFKELQKTSEYTEISMQWIYGLQAAGAKAGASFGDINSALKAVAFQLDEMKRGGDNPLKTLLDANPQFMKGVSRDSMDAAQALRIVSNIISEAKNNIQAIDIAKNLNIPESTVKLLQQGGEAIDELAKKAALAAPDLARIAEQAKLFNEILDQMGEKSKNAAITGLFVYLNYLASTYRAMLEAILPVLDAINGKAAEFARTGIEALKAAEARIAAAQAGKPADGEVPKRIAITGGTAVDPFARKTPAAERDAFDRAADSVAKHTAAMLANSQTVGANVGEQERAKVAAELLSVATRDGATATAEQTQRMKEVSEAAGDAALSLAQAQDKMAKLNSASQQFGQALSTAFADAIVEGKGLNEVVLSLVKTLEKAAINATIMSFFTPSGGQGTSAFLSWLGIGKRAGGGPVGPNKPYVVGENGPELMVPGQAGMVLPNNVLGRAGAGGDTLQNTFYVSGDVSQSTIDRLQQAVISAHRKADGIARVVTSTQRLQATGVA